MEINQGAISAGTGRLITERETQVLRLLAFGCTYYQIADRLGVSLHTVTSHIKNLYRKLEVRSATAAVMRAMQLGLFGRQGELMSETLLREER